MTGDSTRCVVSTSALDSDAERCAYDHGREDRLGDSDRARPDRRAVPFTARTCSSAAWRRVQTRRVAAGGANTWRRRR